MKTKYECIRNLREDVDLTQAQMGTIINVSQRTYAYYESGERMVTPQDLILVAQFHNFSVDYLLGLTDQRETYPRANKADAVCPDSIGFILCTRIRYNSVCMVDKKYIVPIMS